MPPSDRAMKTLPRPDPLQYLSFLAWLGIAKRGKNSILHLLPYTYPVVLGNTLLHCYGATSCKELSRAPWESSSSIMFGSIRMFGETSRRICSAKTDDVLYITPADRRLYILSMSNIRDITLLDRTWLIDEASCAPDIVHGLAMSTEDGAHLALVSSDLLYIEPVNQRLLVVELRRPGVDILASTTRSLINLARRSLSIQYAYSIDGFFIESVPLVEFLDMITLVFPQTAKDNCVEYTLMNAFPRGSNAILKVYGYIDSIEIDGVRIDKYKHSVIRLAVDGKGEVHLKLCISAFIPYAYELRRKLLEMYNTVQ